ncbi:transposase, partial [Escherichia coli]
SRFINALKARIHESGSAELRCVAAGMEADAAAICEAISSRWSTGVVEGHVNRLKVLIRQMYGRAGLELLRRRVMSPLA